MSTKLLAAAKRLEARGFFNASACADKATNADMLAMLQAIEAAERPAKLAWLSYDDTRDVLTIHGRDYAGMLFREDGFLAPPGTVLRIVDNAGQTITVQNALDFEHHIARQRAFSEKTFGPGARTKGVVDHIRKELVEIEAAPADLSEWIDVVILALDGAWRTGATPAQIIAALVAKQDKNEARTWPDWRTADPDKAIEHDRSVS